MSDREVAGITNQSHINHVKVVESILIEIMNTNKKINETKNIDLAYSYTKDFFDDRRTEIENINRKLTTFLLFGGFLLGFGINLPHSRPGYILILSKVMVLLFSFLSISNLLWGLSYTYKVKVVIPSYLMEDECFEKSNTEIKAMIINTHKENTEKVELLTKKKLEIIKKTKAFLLTGTLFFVLNAFWVMAIER
jgi:hypothetical protein